jgi:uncharacterized repeat protein (TIGR04138 family)
MNQSYDKQITEIAGKHSLYHRNAYVFVMNSVSRAGARLQQRRHLSALEVLAEVKSYAISEYGVFFGQILRHWGISKAADIGKIVYLLIEAHILSASPDDNPEDFNTDFDLFDR